MEKMSTLHSSDYHFQLSFLSTPVWSLRFAYAMNPESCEREIRIFFYSVTQQDRAQFFTVNIAVKMATSFQGRFSHCRARGNFPRFTTHALLPIFLEESWVLEWIRVNPDTCWIWYYPGPRGFSWFFFAKEIERKSRKRRGEREKPLVTLASNLTFMQTTAVKRVKLLIKRVTNGNLANTCLSAAIF